MSTESFILSFGSHAAVPSHLPNALSLVKKNMVKNYITVSDEADTFL